MRGKLKAMVLRDLKTASLTYIDLSSAILINSETKKWSSVEGILTPLIKKYLKLEAVQNLTFSFWDLSPSTICYFKAL